MRVMVIMMVMIVRKDCSSNNDDIDYNDDDQTMNAQITPCMHGSCFCIVSKPHVYFGCLHHLAIILLYFLKFSV